MKFSLGSELQYSVASDTTMILAIEAQHTEGQSVVSERLSISPVIDTDTHIDPPTGNRYLRMQLPPGDYTIHYSAEVETAPLLVAPTEVELVPLPDLPLDVMPYLYPSRYCQSDLLARYAWRQFGTIAGGFAKVDAICDWIHRNVDYLAGSSDGSTSAYDTFTLRAGVCRDFAHLGITICRALGIPARFVSAYSWKLVPQDFHAVFEAYLGGRWYLFDPTRLAPADGIVRIAVGRDAADTAFATFFGQLTSAPKSVWVNVLGEDAYRQVAPAEAVSLSA